MIIEFFYLFIYLFIYLFKEYFLSSKNIQRDYIHNENKL